MALCPVCQEELQTDEAAFSHHVNAHFGSMPASSSSSSRPASAPDEADEGDDDDESREACMICNFPFRYLSEPERETHVNACLDGQNDPKEGLNGNKEEDEGDFIYTEKAALLVGQKSTDNRVEEGWDGPSKPGSWSDWVGRKVDRGDSWWDPVEGDPATIPSNISPSTMPILHLVFTQAIQRRLSVNAVLSRTALHIKGVWKFDMGWGCGYRNALMALSSLLIAKPAYRAIFSKDRNGADPGVRRVQGWIEEAWRAGFDRQGCEQLKGKILGTKKWIGASDLYAMFTYMGVPCELVDFPRGKSGKSARTELLRWVKEYFAQDPEKSEGEDKVPTSAYDIMMRREVSAGRGESVRWSKRLPVILQHSGHSRTLIGYEEYGQGRINLLLFDPGRTMPKDIRAAGIEHVRQERQKQPASRPPNTQKASQESSHDSVPFSRPYSNGASEITEVTEDTAEDPEHMRGGSMEMTEDDEIDEGGWVRKKVGKLLQQKKQEEANVKPWEGSAGRALGYFRGNLSSLNSHTQFQVLAFTGGPILSAEEKEARKEVKSTVVR